MIIRVLQFSVKPAIEENSLHSFNIYISNQLLQSANTYFSLEGKRHTQTQENKKQHRNQRETGLNKQISCRFNYISNILPHMWVKGLGP